MLLYYLRKRGAATGAKAILSPAVVALHRIDCAFVDEYVRKRLDRTDAKR